MHSKKLLSTLLLAALVGGAAVDLVAAGSKSGDAKAAEAAKLIEEAEAVRKMAASVDGEWRDTATHIRRAGEALKQGDYDQAIALARIAGDEAALGYEQAMSQKELKLPSYFKVGEGSPSVAVASVSGKGHKITPALPSVDVMHNGQKVTITRTDDENAVIPEAYTSTARECPPFCVQPMNITPGIETIGELEVLEYLKRIAEGDPTVVVVDSRTSEWMVRGTVPGSVNIPWNRINIDYQGSFGDPAETESLNEILVSTFHARKANGKWDFRNAKTLVMFCNGVWCPQSTANIRTLVKLGYPEYKLKWYRGGMQSWVSAGLTTVNN